MRFTTLIDTADLEKRIHDQAWAVVDCRFDLKDGAFGEQAYREAHVPGAVFAHLDRDLSGPKTGMNGRHPLPEPAAAAEVFGRLGIGNETQVVVYDQDSGMYASRLWWMLRWLGHDAVAVLNGGFAKWIGEGRPVSHGVDSRDARAFIPRARPEMVVGSVDVLAIMNRPDWQIMDARAPERFRGDVEPIDPVAGHIPGAVNHCYQLNVDRGTFLPPGDLLETYRQVMGSVDPDHVVCYCGSGVTSCHNLLAMEYAGLKGARLYAGSWSEWCSDPDRPVERGSSAAGPRDGR